MRAGPNDQTLGWIPKLYKDLNTKPEPELLFLSQCFLKFCLQSSLVQKQTRGSPT